MKVTIHRKFHPWYYLFFLQGLAENGVSFDFAELIDAEMEARLKNGGFEKDYLLISIARAGRERLIVIGADDKTEIAPELVNIADVYAKTNVSVQTRDESGIVPLGPTFGLRYLNADILKIAARDVLAGDYNKWLLVAKREPLSAYLQQRKNKGRLQNIFYLNYPWKKHRKLTAFRLSIIQSLQTLDRDGLICFEGGFSKRRFGYHEGLREVSADRLYGHSEYLSSLVSTKIVLNTPAVHSCLGWKMGEFLCLGRCMLSFPIPNVMPYDFKHGVHFHQIEDLGELESTLKSLMNHATYVESIQQQALAYFDMHVRPARVMERLLSYV